jgi:PPOX class probable FMN-dependent enzyme
MTANHRIETVEQLRQLYRSPSPLVATKDQPTIDSETARFIALARFAVIATTDDQGRADASPRGGPAGFIRVVDERTVALADMGGNNRLDSIENILATGSIGLLIVVPGCAETVRVNGRAEISIEPGLLASFGLPRLPKAAIVVHLDATFLHCAKAFHRGDVWEPAAWPDLATVPDAADIAASQGIVSVSADVIRTALQAEYAAELAAERTPAEPLESH